MPPPQMASTAAGANTPAIVERDLQKKIFVARRGGFGMVDQFDDIGRHAGPAAQHLDPHTSLMKTFEVAADEGADQPHEVRDLIGGTAPVLGRETEYRQTADTQIGCRLDGATQSLNAFAVPHGSGHPATLGPPSVAVHNNGHMEWLGIGRCGRHQALVLGC